MRLPAHPGGLLVGILPDPHFAAATTTLGPGDTTLLYTDGLTEARTGPARGLYGHAALRALAYATWSWGRATA